MQSYRYPDGEDTLDRDLATLAQNEQEDRDIKTNRLDAESVFKAFVQTRWQPDKMVDVDTDKGTCCGMMAVHIARGGSYKTTANSDVVRLNLGLSRNYTCGFIVGWDGYAKSKKAIDVSRDWSLGYDEGYAAWSLCRHLWRKDGQQGPDLEGEYQS